MPWHDPQALVRSLSVLGLLLSLVAALPWVLAARISWRISARDIAPLPTVIAVLAGAVFFIPSISWLQIPWQQAISRWLNAVVTGTNPLILMGPVILASGVVQEPAKWLAAAIGLWGGRFRAWGNRRRTAIMFALVGLAYGWAEAWVILSFAGQGFWGPALLERLLAIGFHAGVTGVVGWFWAHGLRRGLTALLVASIYHGLLNMIIIMPVLGLPMALVWLALATAGLLPPAVLATLIGRELRICER